MAKNVFSTSDLALTAYLTSIGYIVQEIGHADKGRAIFHIFDKPDRPEHILEFYNRQTLIEQIDFLDRLKSLKAMLR